MTHSRFFRAASPTSDGLVLAGGAGLLLQIVVLAIVAGSVHLTLVGGLGLTALTLFGFSDCPLAGTIRRVVPVAGVGGLAMLIGPGLDLAKSRPFGTHAGWSLLLMVAACWWLCGKEGADRNGSKAWALGCRGCAVVGMLLGMTTVHFALGAHHTMSGTGFALSHLAMVGAMTAGSAAAVAATAWLDARKRPTYRNG